MADTTNLEVVTPSAIIVSEPVEMVVVPGSDGQIGALPRPVSYTHLTLPTKLEV